MVEKTKIEIELSAVAAGRFAEAAQLLESSDIPGVSRDFLIAFVVTLANPALMVRRIMAHYDPQDLTVDEEYDLEVGFFGN